MIAAGSLLSDENASGTDLLGMINRPSPAKFVVAASPTGGEPIIFYSGCRRVIFIFIKNV